MDRLTISAGNFARAGERSGGNLTLKRLKDLLEDDVKNLSRMTASGVSSSMVKLAATDTSSSVAQSDITDEELESIMNRELFFQKDEETSEVSVCISREGSMYDVVSTADSGQALQGLW